MGRVKSKSPPGPTDREAGIWRGTSVARRFTSPDGMIVLVGRTATDNDILSFKLTSPKDFWFHVAGASGSHVVVLNPDGLSRLPRETARYAAALAAGYSKARRGGRVAIHCATAADISKPRGAAPGKVSLRRFSTVHAAPLRPDEAEGSE
jgi:predicted ribosome quality control (RQC) complex YloA/Tae2 family protein